MKTVAGPRLTDSLPAEGLASCYIPGLMDGFGDRLLMFDNTDSDPLEMLRFHADLADTPGFEEVLQERVRRLGRLTHTAFPLVRAVERLETDGALVLVSTYTTGKRLSALLSEPRPGQGLHPAFVAWVVSQVIQPLSMLQSEDHDFAHGALTADRIILTTDGRVRIVEHVLGSALRHLDRSPARLWREFGLLVPPERSGGPRSDADADVFQVGVLALSMLLARRVTPSDLQQPLSFLLDQSSKAATTRSRVFGDALRLWLERALQVGDRPYQSAAEAFTDLHRLPAGNGSRVFEFLHAGDVNGLATPLVTLESPVYANGQEAHMADSFSLDGVRSSNSTPLTEASPGSPEYASEDLPSFVGDEPVGEAGRKSTAVGRALSGPLGEPDRLRAQSAPPRVAPEPSAEADRVRHTARRRSAFGSRRTRLSIAAGLGVVALAEAIVIATMFVLERPSAPARIPVADPPTLETSGVQRQTSQPVQAPLLLQAAQAPQTEITGLTIATPLDIQTPNAEALTTAIAQAARNQRSGGVRLSAPIELKVLQDDRVLGSSADGPIVTIAGTHQLDLINTSVGFRVRRAITFRAGEITTVAIAVPTGRISLNAEPWAEVWIDNRPFGETPLANLEIPLGEHEVLFRHPELGDRRQNVIVRADVVARASATFDR